jgi:hypothetical protein
MSLESKQAILNRLTVLDHKQEYENKVNQLKGSERVFYNILKEKGRTGISNYYKPMSKRLVAMWFMDLHSGEGFEFSDVIDIAGDILNSLQNKGLIEKPKYAQKYNLPYFG